MSWIERVPVAGRVLRYCRFLRDRVSMLSEQIGAQQEQILALAGQMAAQQEAIAHLHGQAAQREQLAGLLEQVSGLRTELGTLESRLAGLERMREAVDHQTQALQQLQTRLAEQEAILALYDPKLNRWRLPPPVCMPALVVPMDYADVVPAIKDRAAYESLARDFEAVLPAIQEFVRGLTPHFDLDDIPAVAADDLQPHWQNPYYGPQDARIAYGVVRALRPGHILEIGCGESTKFFRKAIRDGGLGTRLVSIDPCPRRQIDQIVDEVHRQRLQDVPLELFETLAPGDVLFFDGSHLAFHGSDVPYFFLRVLPRLGPGVLVQIHDIYLPEEYPEACDWFYYNEQYVLGAFLLGHAEWEPIVPTHFLFRRGLLPEDGCSFWMRRKG